MPKQHDAAPGPAGEQSADYQEAAKIRTKTGLKSIVLLILDRIAAAFPWPQIIIA
jgi:hypothetical protein